MFPGSKNNLNALCRRFNISLENREKHGALTDCYLLLDVYIELLGGKQERLNLSQSQLSITEKFETPKDFEPVLVQLSNEEERLHTKNFLRRLINRFGIKFFFCKLKEYLNNTQSVDKLKIFLKKTLLFQCLNAIIHMFGN